ncbi:diheme cytochrome c SoxA [Roseivivax marinus]|uniref:SoxAX cytochrome complex subunit A n=1 Tax=Roseivivax marinus TaxID=1379903 RepID=W4HNL9_9RHOB|nr:sulfur oxidation c-type cytochrome SoxA [Roseivivax marinus]ETW14294.1 diheme cytochrome c SoxA [Roseivivax marinus]UMA66468.1 sulfur oxidation c-type cytochrome SoxA [Roseivivax marinus]SEK76279.1 sulfur-oxidizing protein SoxA [Roseivivax marinus]
MSKSVWLGGCAAAALMFCAPAIVTAQDDAADRELVINGEIEIVTEADAPAHLENMSTIRSGWTFRSPETQTMQMDDFDNPGTLGVEAAREAFSADLGNGESCAGCHESPEELAGVRAVYPKWDADAGAVQTIEMQINECITERAGAEAWGYDSGEMIDMSALMSFVSRGEAVNVAIDGPAAETWEKGKEIYYTRYGQLELSCANCHEDNYDNMIRADHLSQGQINGFPTYRLKNAKLNSVQGRFKGCVRDTRAETFSPGSPEFVALELYVASRGNGLSVEGPAVRN